jgi:hypothetical protein
MRANDVERERTEDECAEAEDQHVDEAILGSFPASDPPAWTLGYEPCAPAPRTPIKEAAAPPEHKSAFNPWPVTARVVSRAARAVSKAALATSRAALALANAAERRARGGRASGRAPGGRARGGRTAPA